MTSVVPGLFLFNECISSILRRHKYCSCKYTNCHRHRNKEFFFFYLLGYNAVQSVEGQSTFRKNMLPPSSGLRVSQTRNQHEADSKNTS
jgi:hypothetical protein